jgi:hypothetical protein
MYTVYKSVRRLIQNLVFVNVNSPTHLIPLPSRQPTTSAVAVKNRNLFMQGTGSEFAPK